MLTELLNAPGPDSMRRHRHSIPGHLNSAVTSPSGGTSTSQRPPFTTFTFRKQQLHQLQQHQHPALFSTAVISGSSSAPELTSILPSTGVTAIGLGLANLAAIDPCASVGVPAIRPLETLHNGLSLKELDLFLERMTGHPNSSPLPLNSPPIVLQSPYKF